MTSKADHRVSFAGLLTGGWKTAQFKPFRDGVEICELRSSDPVVALLKYAHGARVPRHLHTGLESIFVLDGSQSDENGTYHAGDVVLNPAGSEHSVWSAQGCVILIEWERPIQILEQEDL
jgi:anti-sigma factor ChrR (cupin superfamily)